MEKKDSVIRIVCLGGSSTFGYGNRDNETYPFFLDSLLNKNLKITKCQGYNEIEVVNLGMPFQTSDRIFHLFMAEALPLRPDIVIFYEGYNDASLDIFGQQTKDKGVSPTRIDRLLYELGKRIIFVKFYNDWLLKNALKLDKNEFEQFKKGRSKFFIDNISRIRKQCKELGIMFIVVTQQSQSLTLSKKQLKQTIYEHEVEDVLSELNRSRIKYREACFLAHSAIMDSTRIWADTNNILLIEGIYALDTIRSEIKNFVHLKPKANAILAQAIKSKIDELLECH